MRTTLDLPDPLFREVKARAAREGLKLKELLSRYVEAGLREDDAASQRPNRQQEPFPIPIARHADGTVTPALSNADLNAILEEEELENYRRVINS